MLDGQFFESLGGSLVHSRGTHPDVVEEVVLEDDVPTFRISTNTLGAGFIEAVSNSTLLAIRALQPAEIRGTAVVVPVLERSGTSRIGRFGWQSQHDSLESFSADAYVNEMGITSPLFPDENTSSGRDVAEYDSVADPEDDGVDVIAFANIMRSTKVPSRGPITADAAAGEQLFTRAGCAGCHIFLTHDIGTGDGIPILPTPEFADSANKTRTAPLWALRTRNRLMHDGLSFTKEEAI
jgi:CxxC motif-containing protein (DUF1111 family)